MSEHHLLAPLLKFQMYPSNLETSRVMEFFCYAIIWMGTLQAIPSPICWLIMLLESQNILNGEELNNNTIVKNSLRWFQGHSFHLSKTSNEKVIPLWSFGKTVLFKYVEWKKGYHIACTVPTWHPFVTTHGRIHQHGIWNVMIWTNQFATHGILWHH